MIREIVHDPFFLAQPSAPATAADLPVAQDLTDTLKANMDRCVGMAANMIGVQKRIIVMARGPLVIAMLNPKILQGSGEYETEEGCVSLEGIRKTKTIQIHQGYLAGYQNENPYRNSGWVSGADCTA